jgi:hypothetical protein
MRASMEYGHSERLPLAAVPRNGKNPHRGGVGRLFSPNQTLDRYKPVDPAPRWRVPL